MRVLWLLHEIGEPFEVEVHPFDRSLRSADYLAKHPVGRVPSVELDGKAIWESGAIIEVLCERFPGSGLGRAPGDPERADWLTWVHFAESVSQHTAALTQQHVAIYEDRMRSPIVMKLEAMRLGKCFAAIEGRLGETGDYLLPGGFSAADVAVGQAVYMARYFAETAPFPMLEGWYDRISARPGFQASLPPEGADRLYDRAFYAPWPVDP